MRLSIPCHGSIACDHPVVKCENCPSKEAVIKAWSSTFWDSHLEISLSRLVPIAQTNNPGADPHDAFKEHLPEIVLLLLGAE